ncbi:MAG: PIN domain-containing protein [bacterium]
MTLDTNILIAYLNGEQAVVDFVLEQKEMGRALFVSSISVAELFSLPGLSKVDFERMKEFIDNFISVPFDNELAESAAALRRTYKLSLPDAAIAATALARQSPLVTRDRGFRKIKELTFIEL